MTREELEGMFNDIVEHYSHACAKHPFFADELCADYIDWKSLADESKKSIMRKVSRQETVSATSVLLSEMYEILTAFQSGDYIQARYEVFDTIAVLLRMYDMLREAEEQKKKQVEMQWATDVVMTCYIRRLFCKIDDIYKFLNWMTKDNIFTHAIPRAMNKCIPFLEKQFPWLKDVNREEITKDNWEEHLQRIIAEHGEKLEVEQLPDGEWEPRNPIEELLELMNKKQEDAK